MAITSCSRCSEKIHLRLTSNKSLRKLKDLEENEMSLCFGCFRSLQEFDVVSVLSKIENHPEIEIGDIGTVLMVFDEGRAFEVECLLEDGSNKWLKSLNREQIKWIKHSTHNKPIKSDA